METLRVEFFGGPQDGGEIPPRYLARWAVGHRFTLLEGGYRFEELPDGRRVARFLGHNREARSP
jgi:hypothetical protein